MSEQYWLFSAGPLDEKRAVEWAKSLSGSLPEWPGVEVELIDERQWFARAMDADGVRAALVALKQSLTGPDLPDEIRWSVAGLVSDMETWLEREHGAVDS